MGASLSAGDSPPEKSIHEFTVKDCRRNDVDLSIYKGKVLLVVNVASRCGLTNSNYTQLTELYNKYKDKGFEILAFPCNQFLKQEPGTSEAAQDFACTRFKAEYPIFQKVVFLIPLALCFWEAMPFNVAIRYSRFISCLPVIYFKHMGREQTRKKYRLENLATTKSVKSLLVMPSGGLSKRWRP